MSYDDPLVPLVQRLTEAEQARLKAGEEHSDEADEAYKRLTEKVAELDRRHNILITLKMLGELRAQGVVTLAGKGGAVETLKAML